VLSELPTAQLGFLGVFYIGLYLFLLLVPSFFITYSSSKMSFLLKAINSPISPDSPTPASMSQGTVQTPEEAGKLLSPVAVSVMNTADI